MSLDVRYVRDEKAHRVKRLHQCNEFHRGCRWIGLQQIYKGSYLLRKMGMGTFLWSMTFFTKWTEAFTIPNIESKTVVKIIVEEVIARFGTPRIIHSDQGRQFEKRACW